MQQLSLKCTQKKEEEGKRSINDGYRFLWYLCMIVVTVEVEYVQDHKVTHINFICVVSKIKTSVNILPLKDGWGAEFLLGLEVCDRKGGG